MKHVQDLGSTTGGLVGLVGGASLIDQTFRVLQDERHIIGKYFSDIGSKPYGFKSLLLLGVSFLPMVIGYTLGARLGSGVSSSIRNQVENDYLKQMLEKNINLSHVQKLNLERSTELSEVHRSTTP